MKASCAACPERSRPLACAKSQLTSYCAKQHLLVEGHGPLGPLAQAVPHSLIDGKAREGVRHLRKQKESQQDGSLVSGPGPAQRMGTPDQKHRTAAATADALQTSSGCSPTPSIIMGRSSKEEGLLNKHLAAAKGAFNERSVLLKLLLIQVCFLKSCF